ncbi:hypothetical protein FDP41_009190 [Naegleria fowleri]|uniref:Uncharacterized protein n=1 Tax=Naegleria fowleri TaxID=5763 RepID=A0A6A5B1P7_NAEFO|nr:uncharacterized protein FDP41_009190 [Naegleria fowleri]KAF0972287.1 hypothetical protein FDP41_009190 [Naegleria fowleri]CAG4719023.1 unnamed protein product [Naegleria fowleri]
MFQSLRSVVGSSLKTTIRERASLWMMMLVVVFMLGIIMSSSNCPGDGAATAAMVRGSSPLVEAGPNGTQIKTITTGEKIVDYVSPQRPGSPPSIYYKVTVPTMMYLDVAASAEYGPATLYLKINDVPLESDFGYKQVVSKSWKHEYYRNGVDGDQTYYIGIWGDAKCTFMVNVVDSPINSGESAGLVAGLVISLILLVLAVIALTAGGILYYQQKHNHATRMV